MMRNQGERRGGAPAPLLRALLAVVMVATVIVVLLPQAGSNGADLRPLAFGLVGLAMVAWLADRRRRQATPARRRRHVDDEPAPVHEMTATR